MCSSFASPSVFQSSTAFATCALVAGFGVNGCSGASPADQERLVAAGVDGIFTNKPGQLRALLRA